MNNVKEIYDNHTRFMRRSKLIEEVVERIHEQDQVFGMKSKNADEFIEQHKNDWIDYMTSITALLIDADDPEQFHRLMITLSAYTVNALEHIEEQARLKNVNSE